MLARECGIPGDDETVGIVKHMTEASFDVAVVKMATAIANEWSEFSLQELAVYCQQAVMSGYNPVARPWECIPVRSDDETRVSLWPTYSSVVADGAEWFDMHGIPWQYRVDGELVSSKEERKQHGIGSEDFLYRCVVEYGKRRRFWQREVGQMVKDGWPYQAAIDQAGACPVWDEAIGYGAASLREGDSGKVASLGALRARRNTWQSVVTPSEMHVARKRRNQTLIQDIHADMTTYEGEGEHDRKRRTKK